MSRKPPPEGETKEQKFKRLVEARVTAALEKIRLIENLSNKSVYKYTDVEVEKIFNTLEISLKETRIRFKKKKREKFNL